jgi:hypothetical protein
MSITCRLISECVAETYGIPVVTLYSKRRSNLVAPRRVAWRLARDLTDKSFPEIARHMGGRNHTTVLVGIREIEYRLERQPTLKADYLQMRSAIIALGAASDRTDRLRRLFLDHNAVEVANRYLEAEGSTIPSVEELRALSMGVIHYADELVLLHQDADSRAEAEAEAKRTRRTIAEKLSTAETVARAYQSLQIRKHTTHEARAAAMLDEALNTLSQLFQKDTCHG